ncbi:hypothetical protein [Fibrella aquatilis]|nr:hypothetical protein [Fibrella aquatilis]
MKHHTNQQSSKATGGEFHVINLDEHKPMSPHPLAARRKVATA